jgi:hypothetical protein
VSGRLLLVCGASVVISAQDGSLGVVLRGRLLTGATCSGPTEGCGSVYFGLPESPMCTVRCCFATEPPSWQTRPLRRSRSRCDRWGGNSGPADLGGAGSPGLPSVVCRVLAVRISVFANLFTRPGSLASVSAPLRGRSSVGRALRSQRRGQGFDPPRFHQFSSLASDGQGRNSCWRPAVVRFADPLVIRNSVLMAI